MHPAATDRVVPSTRSRTAALAGVVELVDTRDLGSRGLRRGGSSPSARTSRAERDADLTDPNKKRRPDHAGDRDR